MGMGRQAQLNTRGHPEPGLGWGLSRKGSEVQPDSSFCVRRSSPPACLRRGCWQRWVGFDGDRQWGKRVDARAARARKHMGTSRPLRRSALGGGGTRA